MGILNRQGIIGAMTSGGVGFAFGGPIPAAIGATIGYFVPRAANIVTQNTNYEKQKANQAKSKAYNNNTEIIKDYNNSGKPMTPFDDLLVKYHTYDHLFGVDTHIKHQVELDNNIKKLISNMIKQGTQTLPFSLDGKTFTGTKIVTPYQKAKQAEGAIAEENIQIEKNSAKAGKSAGRNAIFYMMLASGITTYGIKQPTMDTIKENTKQIVYTAVGFKDKVVEAFSFGKKDASKPQ
jgi:hypothetical protein